MNSKIVFLCLAVIVLSSLSEAGKGKGKWMNKCKGEEMLKNEKFMTAMKTCRAEHKSKSKKDGDEKSESKTDGSETTSTEETGKGKGKGKGKNPCFMACQWRELGIVKDGAVSTSDFNTMIEETYPTVAQSDIKTGVASCITANTQTLTTEPNCESYQPLLKCIMDNHMKVCKSSDAETAPESEPEAQ